MTSEFVVQTDDALEDYWAAAARELGLDPFDESNWMKITRRYMFRLVRRTEYHGPTAIA